MQSLTRDKAQSLIETTTTQPHLLQHALAVSSAMGAMARHFEADEAYWQAIGILHDYDYETHPDEHLQHTAAPLAEAGIDETSIRAILAHGWGICTDVEPKTQMEKSLYAVDELTGLISAAARMRPDGIVGLEVSSLKKKFKDKKFAAKINREVIQNGADMLEIELPLLMQLCIDGMRPHAQQLGLLGTAQQ